MVMVTSKGKDTLVLINSKQGVKMQVNNDDSLLFFLGRCGAGNE